MNEKIKAYVNILFAPYEGAKSVAELKSDLLADLNERFDDLTAQGKDEEAALTDTLDSIGDIEKTLGEMANLTRTLERQVLVNFSGQELTSSDFAGVTLHGGKFEGSAMKGTDFSGADLTGSSFKGTDLRGAKFDRANLTGCTFSAVDLKDASFREAILVRSDFSTSDLGGAKFTHVKLTDVNFFAVSLTNVTFEGCRIDGGEFKYADLSGQNFDGIILRNVQLGSSGLEGVSFQRARLLNVSFTPPFSLSKKYYRAIKTIRFDGAFMDKLTYNALKGLGANLSGVTIL